VELHSSPGEPVLLKGTGHRRRLAYNQLNFPSSIISKESLTMKTTWLVVRICAAIAIVAGLISIGQAQNREKHVISAKAGGVNAVSGHVMVTRAGQGPQLLSSQDDLVAGDLVKTGVNSQAEILLNPGSYLRLAENSEMILADNSLDNLLVRLNRGSVIIEATGADDTQLRIGVATEQQHLIIARRGIYRINAIAGSTELVVEKGRAFARDNPRELIKGGKKVTYTGGTAFIAKLEKSDRDTFDSWSKERGKALAKANDKLSARTLNGFLSSRLLWTAEFSGRSGFWTFNPSMRCYTFLPIQNGWSSPNGGFFGQFLSPYGFYGGGCCGGGRYYRPVITSGPPYSGSPGSSGSSGGYPGGSPVGSGPANPPSSVGPAPIRMPSQAGPRDPDSGGRRVPRIDK
jgi:hypothetical protein